MKGIPFFCLSRTTTSQNRAVPVDNQQTPAPVNAANAWRL
jgi:hypothetical protein